MRFGLPCRIPMTHHLPFWTCNAPHLLCQTGNNWRLPWLQQKLKDLLCCSQFFHLYIRFLKVIVYFGWVLFLIILIMSSKVVTASLLVFLSVSKITQVLNRFYWNILQNLIMGQITDYILHILERFFPLISKLLIIMQSHRRDVTFHSCYTAYGTGISHPTWGN